MAAAILAIPALMACLGFPPWHFPGGIAAAGLLLAVLLAPLPWMAHPETWLGSWLLLWTLEGRQGWLAQGRPALLAIALVLALLAAWRRETAWPRARWALTALAFAGATYARGGPWILLLIPASFLAVRADSAARSLFIAWIAGAAAACLPGQPSLLLASGTSSPFTPMGEAFALEALDPAVLPALAFALYRWSRGQGRELAGDPALVLWGAAWLIGLKLPGVWHILGYPAAALWLAGQLEPGARHLAGQGGGRRFAVAAFLGLAALLHFTADPGGRWSRIPPAQTGDRQ